MRSPFLYILVLLLAFGILAGCSGNKKKPTEDSIIAMEALSTVDELRSAYESKKFSEMARHLSTETYRKVTGNLKSFESVELGFTTRWIEINRDGDLVDMLVMWQGKWETGKGTVEKDGSVQFILKGKPLKIVKIKRLSPFRQP
jgi:hypothetical protein